MRAEKMSRANISWHLAWQFARPEMRGSVAKFRVFLAALMLGVAAIGAVGSVASSMRAGISENARTLLGGDIELHGLLEECPRALHAVAGSCQGVPLDEACEEDGFQQYIP